MEISIAKQKQILRTQMRTQRDALPLSQKQSYDTLICTQLADFIYTINAQTIHCYLPINSEIDIKPLIKTLLIKGKTIICPKTLQNRQLKHIQLNSLTAVEEGLLGTTHPIGNEFTGKIDMIIVPGLAFDKNNYRLGYGGGYYDSFLATHRSAITIGVCYPFQLVESVPREQHDVKLSRIFSNRD